MAKNDLEKILKELESVYTDIRAEALVTEITENSTAEVVDFTIQNLSTFKRPYSRDILDLKNSLLSTNDYTLQLNLSRNGIYDSLPEGVFHDASDPSLKGMSHQKKRERQKIEEKDARIFFQPIENEIFNQYLEIEKTERLSINRFSEIKNNFLLRFWQIDANFPPQFVFKIIKLLPFAYKISGNLDLAALCLEKIIGKKVKFVKKLRSYSVFKNKGENADILGVNYVLGVDESTILLPEIEVTIGPIKLSEASNFVEGSIWMQFIDTFYKYFLPMELEVHTHIHTERSDNNFTLNETEPAIMGLTTAL